MKAIVTRRNPDGTYDEVGMNNRRIFGPYKRESTIHKRAKDWVKGPYRAEIFGDSIHGEPLRVEFRS